MPIRLWSALTFCFTFATIAYGQSKQQDLLESLKASSEEVAPKKESLKESPSKAESEPVPTNSDANQDTEGAPAASNTETTQADAEPSNSEVQAGSESSQETVEEDPADGQSAINEEVPPESTESSAQEDEDNDPSFKSTDSTRFDFGESLIEGNVKAPENFYLKGKVDQKLSEMVRLRLDFRNRLRNSKDAVRSLVK